MRTKIRRRLLPSPKWKVSNTGLKSVGEIANVSTAIVSTQLTIRLNRLTRLTKFLHANWHAAAGRRL